MVLKLAPTEKYIPTEKKKKHAVLKKSFNI